jgi:DNA topoisomerase I
VADGNRDWVDMISKFYNPFHTDVEKTTAEAERVSGERVLGNDPNTGRTVLVRMAKYGPVAQIGTPEELGENEKPVYANLQKGQSIETISLPDALKLFDLPKQLGKFEEMDVTVGIGRFGPYVKFGDIFVSIPRIEDPLSMTLDRAVELFEEKRLAEAPVFMYKSLPITKGTGRFGPFIKWNDMFINVPRKFTLDTLTLEQAAELIDAKNEKESNRFIHNWTGEKITVENGRWGPFIRFGKHMLNLKKEGKRLTAEDATTLTLDEVKKMIEEEVPDAFAKKPAKAGKAAKPKAKK